MFALRTRGARLALVALVFGAAGRPAWSQAARSPAVARAVVTVGFTVADLDRSVAFFRDVLAFAPDTCYEVAGDAYERLDGVFPVRKRVARVRLGSETIELTQYLAPAGRPISADARSNDRTFQHVAIVVRDMDSAYARLRAHAVRHVSSGPQLLPAWNPNAGGISAFYFRDPDGHPLELIHFPAGKGDPRWQRPTTRLFLGIDHTAIVVANTETSLAFYRDALGLHVAGASENYGPEQERLNAVFGAHLRITALRASDGPGIEFLEYLAPGDGRPAPADERASDLSHWQTTVLADDADSVLTRLRAAGYRRVSSGVIALPEAPVGVRRAVLVRDPDGHVVQVVER